MIELRPEEKLFTKKENLITAIQWYPDERYGIWNQVTEKSTWDDSIVTREKYVNIQLGVDSYGVIYFKNKVGLLIYSNATKKEEFRTIHQGSWLVTEDVWDDNTGGRKKSIIDIISENRMISYYSQIKEL